MSAQAVFGKIERSDLFSSIQNILMYNSLPDELSSKDAIVKWSMTKNIFLPRVNGCELEILPYSKNKITIGAFGIEEPTGEPINDISIIDMIIVPGIAFDRKRNRLGRGKGFYDRLLKNSNAKKIGVAYDIQIVNEIPAETHDCPVDAVITPNNIIQ